MSKRAWLLFGALSVIWGIPYLLIRISVREVAPSTLIFFRTAPVALVLLPVIAHRGQIPELLRRWKPLLAYTAAEILLPWLMLFKAEEKLTSSLAGLLLAAVPLMGVLIARLSGDADRLDAKRVAGLLLGLAGVGLLVGVDVRGATALPIAEMLVPIFGYALGPRIFDRHLSDLPSLGVVAGSLTVATIVYAPFTFSNLPTRLSAEVTASVVTLAVVPTFLGFLVFFSLINEIGPVRTTVVTYVNPAVALVLGVLLLHEPFTFGLGVGLPLIIAGSVLAAARRSGKLGEDPGAAGGFVAHP
ncbi:MAG: DMT family transporter [Acidimicrobiales bacterium]|jgi:drug/metabolite transporter (DMT)-like permease